jgi:hypothetical protein
VIKYPKNPLPLLVDGVSLIDVCFRFLFSFLAFLVKCLLAKLRNETLPLMVFVRLEAGEDELSA